MGDNSHILCNTLHMMDIHSCDQFPPLEHGMEQLDMIQLQSLLQDNLLHLDELGEPSPENSIVIINGRIIETMTEFGYRHCTN